MARVSAIFSLYLNALYTVIHGVKAKNINLEKGSAGFIEVYTVISPSLVVVQVSFNPLRCFDQTIAQSPLRFPTK